MTNADTPMNFEDMFDAVRDAFDDRTTRQVAAVTAALKSGATWEQVWPLTHCNSRQAAQRWYRSNGGDFTRKSGRPRKG